MKIKKGDILIGTCPYTGEKVKMKYLGESEKGVIRYNGFKHIVIEKRKGEKSKKNIISDEYAKKLKLKVLKSNG